MHLLVSDAINLNIRSGVLNGTHQIFNKTINLSPTTIDIDFFCFCKKKIGMEKMMKENRKR